MMTSLNGSFLLDQCVFSILSQLPDVGQYRSFSCFAWTILTLADDFTWAIKKNAAIKSFLVNAVVCG